MNMRRRHNIRIILALLLSVALFASCSQNELAEQGAALPDGMYPMTFTAVQASPESTPQTRVSENTDGKSSQWDGGEVIKVTVSEKGNNMETTCTLDKNGDITAYNPQLYWQNTNYATINAWYSNIAEQSTVTEKTVSLADQSGGLAYVLKVEEPVEANYQTKNIALKFSHQLTKIRVKLEKGSYQGNLSNATVKVKGYTSCTVTNGEVSEGSGEGYIIMHKNGDWYEANLVPGTLKASEAFDISADGKNTKANLQNDVVLKKGKVHEITINVEGKYILIEGGKEDTYTVTKNKPVIIRGDVTVNFDGYDVSDCYNGATIKIESGSPTLIFEGTGNKIECGEAPILLAPGAGVTIKGSTDKPEGSQLIVSSGGNHAGIGSNPGDRDNIPDACGNITIENITLHTKGSNDYIYSGAGIGTAGGWASSCGNITITNSIVHAQGGIGAAAIGIGNSAFRNVSCGKITITDSQIFATVEYFLTALEEIYKGYPACIGHGAATGDRSNTATVGEISITTKESETEFFSNDRFKCTNGNTTDFYKAGKGTAGINTYEGATSQVWSGVKFNDKELASGDKDGYPEIQ